ncbi:MAG: sigma-70 family RNA polymerase sigma factor [Acidobacteria bacterium]|nr:sigma-70 family RNA polymerase sigma factor [Acidobacteriota bacterium]MCB9397810.1 sigma-70 family RNA polymerase sigma factor [Acidobacteriota bacterium]
MHPTKSAWLRDQLNLCEGKLLRYAQSLLGDLTHAQDMVQESFLRLAQQEPFDPTLPWLLRVCRNLITDHFRKDKHMVDATLDQRIHPAPSPLDQLETQDITQRLMRLVHRLPATQREIVRLKFQEGLSYKEIGEITGLTANHVGVLLHQAMTALRKKMSTLEVRT